MAESGFDNGPPSKKPKTSSPASGMTAFDPDTAEPDLSVLLNELSDVLSPELMNSVSKLPMAQEVTRKIDDTIQNNQHLSALLGTDVPLIRDSADNILRFPMNVPMLPMGPVSHQPGGTVNWSVRQPTSMPPYRVPMTNITAGDALPSQPDVPQQTDFVPGHGGYLGGSGLPPMFGPGFGRGKVNPAARMTTCQVPMRVRMPVPGSQRFGVGLSGNIMPPIARPGLGGADKQLPDDQMVNGNYPMLSGDLVKPYGAGLPPGATSQTYSLNGAISEFSTMTSVPDVHPLMTTRPPMRPTVNPPSCEPIPPPPAAGAVARARMPSDSSGQGSVHNNIEKQRLIQQQLVLIFHAHKCHRREQANGAHNVPCPLPQCQSMKSVLRHMVTCTDGRSCRVPHCASSRQIIAHWRNCSRPDCPICSPLKNGTLRRAMPQAALPAPGAVAPTVANPVYQGFSPKHATAVHPPAMSLGDAATIASMSMASIATSGTAIGATFTGLKILQSSMGEGELAPGQDWRMTVTQDLRNHLVHKLVQAIFPTHEPLALKDPRMNNLVQYAKKVEGDMYEKARSREDYYHLLAEKIYKIQKELEQKKLRRISDQNGMKSSNLRPSQQGPGDNLCLTIGLGDAQLMSPSSPVFMVQGETSRTLQQLQGLNSAASSFLDSSISPLSSSSRSSDLSGLLQNSSFNPVLMVPGSSVCQNRDNSKLTPSFSAQSTPLATNQMNDISQTVISHQMDSKSQLASVLSKRCQEIELMEKRQIQNDLMSPTSLSFLHASSGGLVGGMGNGGLSSFMGQGWDKSDSKSSLMAIKQELGFYSSGEPLFSPGNTTLAPSGLDAINPTTATNHLNDDDFSFEPLSTSMSSTDIRVDIKHEDITDDESGATKSESFDNSDSADRNPAAVAASNKMSKKEVEVKTEAKNSDFGFPDGQDVMSAVSSAEVKSDWEMKPDMKVEVKAEPMCDDAVKSEAETGEKTSQPESSENGQAENAVKSEVKPGKKVWSQDEIRQAFVPLIDKLYAVEPEAAPFRAPVDPVALCIPDYFQIVKKPMDLSTIHSKLESAEYTDPWHVIEDVQLMFDNAWLYNRKTSKVYKYCTKLAEVFEADVDPVMQSLGFCCGRRYVFTPQVLCCFGKQLCIIPRDSTYYNYLDRYIYCEKCFSDRIGDEIEILDDPSNPGLKIKKESFVREKNDKLDFEPTVDCAECGRRMHKICALHLEQIWSTGFICDPCRKMTGQKRKENKFTAKRLPPTKLGTYLENRINSMLKRKAAGAGDVTVRVLSSYDKSVEVKPAMKARFVDSGQMSETFPYRVKAIFAFEEIDDVDVCFFGMHVQEYGSDCPASNARRVYIAYLDSVNFFQPRHCRTMVYHELLIGYMDYVKGLGFQMAHIWACPPSEGDDYIFYCHPPDMKIPKPKRLQEWYRKMLDKAICDRAIFDYKDIWKDAVDNNLDIVTELPYFEGDFWPNVLEENIKELNQEMEKRQREEEEAAVDTDDGETKDGSLAELHDVAGKKKDQKSGQMTKKKNPKTKKLSSRRTKSSAQNGNDLTTRVLNSMEKHKEVFFVIRLQPKPADSEAELGDIKDPDPLMNNELMDGRDPLLTMARDKHLEFSSLRRAKFSTAALLYELHMQAKDNFIYTCNNCKASVETRYHCVVCEDYDLCVSCYRKLQHLHHMTKLGLDLDDGSQGDTKPQNPQEARRLKIQTYVQMLEHSCICRDANCKLGSCRNMRKTLAMHPKECRRNRKGACATCKQLFALCCYHAKACREKRCHVPFCQNIKANLEKQRQKERLQQQRSMMNRVALMRCMGGSSDSSHAPPQYELSIVPQQTARPSYMGVAADGKPGKVPQMTSSDAAFHPQGQGYGPVGVELPGPLSQQSEFMSPNQQYSPMGDMGWAPPGAHNMSQFGQPDPYGQPQGIHQKALPEAGAANGGARPPGAGPVSLERLMGVEDRQKLYAVLKSNPRLMAEFIKKARQHEALNQQAKQQLMQQQQQQQPMMLGSGSQQMPMVDGGIRNSMGAFPGQSPLMQQQHHQQLQQQPGINMSPVRQAMYTMSKASTSNGDHGHIPHPQQQVLDYHPQPPQQQQQVMMPQGFDGYQGGGMMPCHSYPGFSMAGNGGLPMNQDFMAGRVVPGRMPFSQAPPRHIHPQLMNNSMHCGQPHASPMSIGGFSAPQDMMGAPPGIQLQGDPSTGLCSLTSASPLSASSPRPANSCSPSPHHLPSHYINKVLPHSTDSNALGVVHQRTGSLGQQPLASGSNQLSQDGSAARQLTFSPGGKKVEIPNSSLTRSADSFSHFLDRK